ncbi:MAG TPA: hypothetical protein DCS87_09730 [Rheinheimera sp.]|nr:hypothetical protein [Rheinheimera sp.]
MRWFTAILLTTMSASAAALPGDSVFKSDFENSTSAFSLVSGCKVVTELARSGKFALQCQEGQSSLISQNAVAEAGLLEFWVQPANQYTQYRISIMASSSLKADSVWQQIGLIENTAGSTSYMAHRVSIDDPSRKFIRFDIEASNGTVVLDDINIERIPLDTALQKNENRIVTGLLDKLRQNKNADVQAEQLKTLGKNYAAQLDTQRQYLEYANGIYSSITFVLASSERNKMSNPMAYNTFRAIVTDAKRVASPLQQARLNSMIKPFGDLATATLNVVSGGTYAAFSEPFKSFLAATFDKSNYENADLSRKDRKFAEENGLKIYENAEKFLTELERELQQVTALEADLQNLLRGVDTFRKDLDKHSRDYMQHGGMARTQENFSRVMSKDEAIRAAIAKEVEDKVTAKALTLLQNENNTDLVQYMLRTSEQLEAMQEFKERFNGLTSALITFYDRFERSIAPDQNPFSEKSDRDAWEQHAKKAREYIKQSKEAFAKAYM